MSAPARRPLLERGIASIAPGWALRREQSRLKLHQVERALKLARKFDGAARGRRGKYWPSTIGGANTELWGSLPTLRARSRDARQNDPWIGSGVEAWVDNAIGLGIQPSFKHSSESALKIVRDAWKLWAESTSADAEGLTSYYGLQAQAFDAVVSSGEAVIMPVYGDPKRGEPALSIRVREGDFIDSQLNEQRKDGGRIVQGVEYDKRGQRVAVWMFDEHPSENGISYSKSVQARRYAMPDEAFLIMRRDRPGQARGIPWTAATLLRGRDLQDFEEAQLVQQKIAACFSVFIETDGLDDPTGGTPLADDVDILEEIGPGIIETLPPGRKISTAQPTMPHGYADYQAASLRAVAVGMGIPYELLSGDYRSFPFSAARMSRMGFNRRLRRVQRHVVIPQFCDVTMRWWSLAAQIAGLPIARATVDRWIPPRQDMVQPEKDVPANIARLKAGLVSHLQLIREGGESEPEEVLEEHAWWQEQCEKRELKFEPSAEPEPEEDDPPSSGSDKRGVNGHSHGRINGCLV